MKSSKEQKIRKSVPRGLGKKEKPGPREDFQKVHEIRKFGDLLKMRGMGEWGRETAQASLKDWLRDWEHFCRMTGLCDEQDVIYDLLKSLEEPDGDVGRVEAESGTD